MKNMPGSNSNKAKLYIHCTIQTLYMFTYMYVHYSTLTIRVCYINYQHYYTCTCNYKNHTCDTRSP